MLALNKRCLCLPNRVLVIITGLFFYICAINAQTFDRYVVGSLFDKATGVKIDRNNYMEKMNVIVYLSNGDSVVNENGWYDENEYYFMMPKDGGALKLKIEVEGYEPYFENLTIKPFKNVERKRTLHNIKLTRPQKNINLEEVQIKASKVKFYYKGDTLVYNADAFDTPQGSMLSDLIKMLPGVEIKDGGEIFVNGKRIDALLLNGEHMFNNKNELLLDNLPNYTVKNIQVYDKESLESKYLSKGIQTDEYVMDVKLKKQYCKGLIGNLEIGYGSKERYLTSLFGLRFTDFSRLSFYVNVNNLNDNRKPGEKDQWTPESMPKGLVARKKAGFDYMIKKRGDLWTLNGGVEGVLSTSDNYQETTKEQLLPSGSLFSKSLAQNKGKFNSINTYHTFALIRPKYFIRLSPTASYTKSKNRETFLSATFDVDPDKFIKGNLADTLRQVENSEALRQYSINRVIREGRSEGTVFNAKLKGTSVVDLGVNSLLLEFLVDEKEASSKIFSQSLYDYPRGTREKEFQNRYIKNKPNRNLNLSGNVRLNLPLDLETTLGFSYEYKHQQDKQDNEFNLLNRLEDWNEMGSKPLGALPSEVEFKRITLDAENSYNKQEICNKNVLSVFLDRFPNNLAKDVNVKLVASLNFQHNNLDYYRGNGFDQTIYSGVTRKNFVLQSYLVRIDLPKGKKHRSHPILLYQLNQTAPALLSMLDGFTNTSDPLNVFTGNRDLKTSTEHKVSFEWRKKISSKHVTSLFVSPQWVCTTNAQAYGSVYDTNTGVRHYRPENVNGNYKMSLDVNIVSQLGKNNKWSFNMGSNTVYQHGVDLVSTEGMPQRSVVNTVWNKETVNVSRPIGKHRIGLKGSFSFSHSSSPRENFDSFTLYDFNYGLNAVLRLPWNAVLSTDFTIYSRRGYADSFVNTNDVVWNARISKSIAKGKIIIMLDGFDILNQLSNVTQVVNSQGRTETYYNALPRYVMAHLIYKFHKAPKTNRGQNIM